MNSSIVSCERVYIFKAARVSVSLVFPNYEAINATTSSVKMFAYTNRGHGKLLRPTSFVENSLTMSQDDSPPPLPSKEEIAEGYQGSKEESLQWRAEELAMVAQETTEVNADVRAYEQSVMQRLNVSTMQ